MSTQFVSKQEPALSIAGLAALAGFLLHPGGADGDGLQTLAIALGLAGGQGALTRQMVVRPAKAGRLTLPEIGVGGINATAAGANQAEPALIAGVVTTIIGFLVQLLAGVDPMQALAVAGGVSGAQAVATRQAVYSPRSAAQRRWADLADAQAPATTA